MLWHAPLAARLACMLLPTLAWFPAGCPAGGEVDPQTDCVLNPQQDFMINMSRPVFPHC